MFAISGRRVTGTQLRASRGEVSKVSIDEDNKNANLRGQR